MEKIELKRGLYEKPVIEVIKVNVDCHLLAESPNVQPGGGKGGSVSVENTKEDNTNTELTFEAKRSNMFGTLDNSTNSLWE